MSVDAGALAHWIAAQEGVPHSAVRVEHLQRIDSVGNAREPWSCTVHVDAPGGAVVRRCVLLVKAAAGQLETTLPPEFAALRAVHGTAVPAPEPLWLDATGDAFGRPFFATAHVLGDAGMQVLRAEPGDAAARGVIVDLARAAAALHVVDVGRCDPSHLPPVDAAGAALAQLDHWQPLAERQLLEPMPALRWAFAWLRAHAPVAERVSIVHGDLRVGNFLAHDGRVTALLDWEMAHLGDPLEDLAWTYRSLWSPTRALSYEEFLTEWSARSGLAVDRRRLCWYRMFNEVKHGVISLTAARAFHERRTTNLRMADRNLTLAPFLATFFALRREHDAEIAA